MAATELGEELETSFGDFTDRFRMIMALNYGQAFMRYYNPDNSSPLIASILNLHNMFESKYQTVSERFYQAYRQSETGIFAPVPFTAAQNSPQAVITNLMIHGPQAIKQKEKVLGIDWEEFTQFQKEQSLSHVTGELVHKTLEAPRANMMDTIKKDPEVSRWIRKTNSGACKFCKMLASRGAVFKKDTVRFASHSSCGCHVAPVYKGYKIDPDHEKAAQEWLDENKGAENKSRRAANNAEDVRKGLKEKKVEKIVDKYGRESTRTTYVDTAKGKELKAAEDKKAQDALDSLKRDGTDYKEVPMSDFQRKDNESQAKKVMEEMKIPKKLNKKTLSTGAREEIKLKGLENLYTV
jgi:hypothetical protein